MSLCFPSYRLATNHLQPTHTSRTGPRRRPSASKGTWSADTNQQSYIPFEPPKPTFTITDLVTLSLQTLPTFKLAFRALRAAGLLAGLGLTALAVHQQNQRSQAQRQGRQTVMSSSRHLDLSGDREVVYCHNCENEWYKEEDDLQCPRCHSEICEIVSSIRLPHHRYFLTFSLQIEPDNDPRPQFETPPPPPFHSRPFGSHDHDFPDPDEDNIDDFMSNLRRPRDSPSQGPGSPGQRPVDPGSQDEIFMRFQETLNMLMGGMGGGPLGPPGRSDRETIFGRSRAGGRTQTRIVRLPGGTTTFSITTGNIPIQSPGDRDEDHDDDFDMYGTPHSFPTRLSGIPEVTYFVLCRSDADPHPRIFGNVMGGGNVRAPNGGDPTFNGPLQNIFSLLFAGGPNAVHGDAVYSQEALDRIITQLMEANPSSNAAPPASEAAIEKLQKKKLDREMMGDGKAECTICIDDMKLGDEVTVLPCNHWFHEECVVLWLKEHNTCPICRAPIEKRDANENRGPNDGNGEAGDSPGNHQRRASEGGQMPPSSGWLGGSPSGWASGSSRTGGFGGSSRSRALQTPEDRERRLNAIRTLAGASSYGQPSSEPPRWNTFRRDSWSPTSPPPGASSARERSPTRPRPGRSNSSSWNSQRSSNNSGGNGTSTNPLSWIRDRFSGSSGNNQNNTSGRRRS